MDALYKMMTAASKLETALADGSHTPATLRRVMKEVAGDLSKAAQDALPKWGELARQIRDLEKGPQ